MQRVSGPRFTLYSNDVWEYGQFVRQYRLFDEVHGRPVNLYWLSKADAISYGKILNRNYQGTTRIVVPLTLGE